MFKTYINKQKGTQEIVKKLFDNNKRYDKSSTVGVKNQNPNKSKHVPLPPADLPSSYKRLMMLPEVNALSIKAVHSLTPR